MALHKHKDFSVWALVIVVALLVFGFFVSRQQDKLERQRLIESTTAPAPEDSLSPEERQALSESTTAPAVPNPSQDFIDATTAP